MDFSKASPNDLDQHIMENMVFDRPAVSPVLMGHLLIEQILDALLARKMDDFPRISKRHRMGFDLKVDLASALGLLDNKFHSAFKALNKIRNEFGHRHDFELDFPALSGLKFDWDAIQDEAFKVAHAKGVEEAARIAVIFLCWKAVSLLES